MNQFTPRTRYIPALLLATTLGFIQACDDDDDPLVPQTITVSLSPTSGSAQQGGSTNTTVTVTGGAGFVGTPAVAVTGAPTGVTATVSPITGTGGTRTATITFNVAGTAAPGVYPLTVNATGPGISAVSTTYTLTVSAFSFSLAFTPPTLSVLQGTSGTSTVNITRNNLTGNVALAVTGAPAGVTATLSPTTTSGTTSTLTVTAAANAALGAATLTLTGTSAGAADQTATLPITITAPTSSVGLTLTPTAVSIAQGANASTSIALARTNFTGNVTFAAENLPAGVTANFVPNPNTGTGPTTLTLTTSGTTPVATTPITIRATGTGIAAVTSTLNLSVVAPGQSVGLSATPATLSVARGANATRTIDLARTNFTGGVTLTVEGLPAGVTAAFAPSPATGATSVMTITVPATATPGTYTLTIRGTGSGITDATMTFALTIT
jgi:hypothetical protein